MFTSIFKVFKNFLGFNSEAQSRKRPHQDARDLSAFYDDNTTDEEADYEQIKAVKRQKLNDVEYLDDMATWIKPPQRFSQCFIYSKENPAHDVFNRESTDRLFARPKPRTTGRNQLLSSSESLTGTRSEARQDDENDENKCSQKTSFSDSQSTNFEKMTPQRSISKHRFMNGSHHVHSYDRKCGHECEFHSNMSSSETRNNFASRLTVCTCAQIQEKEKYRQLLNRYPQPFTPIYGNDSLSLRHNVNHNLTNLGSSYHKNSVTREKLNNADKEQQIQRLLKSGSSKTKQPSKWNLSVANGVHSPINEASFVEKSIKLDKPFTPSNRTVPVASRKSKKTVNEVPKWKLKSEELNCPYTDKNWLESWNTKRKTHEQEKKRQIAEAKKRIDVLTPPWDKEFRDLEKNIKDQLSIAEKQSEVLEEIYTIKDDKDLLDDEKIEPMPELSPEMEKKIDGALRPKPPNEILVDKFQIPIHRRDMETLQDLNWLNDAIINFYMNLLMERGKLDNMPSVYACNTFFYPKLITGGHAALKRWTRRTDIFSYDIMLVPVHLGVHWCLAVVDFRKKMIKYYDSMRGKNNECLNALSTYLKEESLDKKKQTLSMDDWIMKNVTKAPQQMNSSDCGMFACKYAEYITRNAKITFKQHHMPYFRRRMVYEILTAQLL